MKKIIGPALTVAAFLLLSLLTLAPAPAAISTPVPQVRILCSNAATGMAVTGTTSATVLATCVVPANAMGPNGMVRVTTLYSFNNSGNNKTMEVRFGTTSAMIAIFTTQLSYSDQTLIQNRGATNAQVMRAAGGGGAGGWGNGAALNTTMTKDTTTNQNIEFVCTLANSADTCTLERYLVELIAY